MSSELCFAFACLFLFASQISDSRKIRRFDLQANQARWEELRDSKTDIEVPSRLRLLRSPSNMYTFAVLFHSLKARSPGDLLEPMREQVRSFCFQDDLKVSLSSVLQIKPITRTWSRPSPSEAALTERLEREPSLVLDLINEVEPVPTTPRLKERSPRSPLRKHQEFLHSPESLGLVKQDQMASATLSQLRVKQLSFAQLVCQAQKHVVLVRRASVDTCNMSLD